LKNELLTSEQQAKVERAGKQMAFYLDEIAKLFSDEVKITLLVRNPVHPERSAYLSDEADIERVCAALRQLHDKPSGGSFLV
jgi:hypothetical protein